MEMMDRDNFLHRLMERVTGNKRGRDVEIEGSDKRPRITA